MHVRRQLKKLGTEHIYALPRSDLTRDVPLPDWVAAAVRRHVAADSPWSCTLPFEKLTGKPETRNLIVQWDDGSYVRCRSYSEMIWKPALAKAGIIPDPATDKRGRKRHETTRRDDR